MGEVSDDDHAESPQHMWEALTDHANRIRGPGFGLIADQRLASGPPPRSLRGTPSSSTPTSAATPTTRSPCPAPHSQHRNWPWSSPATNTKATARGLRATYSTCSAAPTCRWSAAPNSATPGTGSSMIFSRPPRRSGRGHHGSRDIGVRRHRWPGAVGGNGAIDQSQAYSDRDAAAHAASSSSHRLAGRSTIEIPPEPATTSGSTPMPLSP